MIWANNPPSVSIFEPTIIELLVTLFDGSPDELDEELTGGL